MFGYEYGQLFVNDEASLPAFRKSDCFLGLDWRYLGRVDTGLVL